MTPRRRVSMIAARRRKRGGDPIVAQTLDVDRVHWAAAPIDFQWGAGGSGTRGLVAQVGTTHYLWESHAADTPAGVVQTGFDPGDFPADFPETVNRTGIEVQLPAGYVSPADHAAAVATAIAAADARWSASVGAAQTDGRHRVSITAPLIVVGTRSLPNPLDARTEPRHGGRAYRLTRAGEAYSATSQNLTAPVATAVTTWSADAIAWAVQMQIGSTAGTGDTARPALELRVGSAGATSAADSTRAMRFGQVPASQIAAGQLATIYLTAAQCRELRDARAAIGSGRAWLTAHAQGGCHYASAPTSGTLAQGDQVAQNLRIHNGSIAPASNGPTTWVENGAGAALWLNARLVLDYADERANNGEHVRMWGVPQPASAAPNAVGPINNQPVLTTGEYDSTLANCRVLEVQNRVNGAARMMLHEGGSGAKTAPNSAGSTRFADLGSITGDGTAANRYIAPTGAAAIYVPASVTHLWFLQKASGATGYGDTASGSPATVLGTPTDATPCICSTPGASIGNCTMQEDRIGEDGDPTTTSVSPTAGTELNVDACPWRRLYVVQLPMVAAVVP